MPFPFLHKQEGFVRFSRTSKTRPIRVDNRLTLAVWRENIKADVDLFRISSVQSYKNHCFPFNHGVWEVLPSFVLMKGCSSTEEQHLIRSLSGLVSRNLRVKISFDVDSGSHIALVSSTPFWLIESSRIRGPYCLSPCIPETGLH